MQVLVRWLTSVFLLLCMAALFFIAVKNLEYIYIDIPFVAQFRVMTAVALASAFFIGALLTSLFFGLWLMQSHMRCRALGRELKKLKKSIAAELEKVKNAAEQSFDEVRNKPSTGFTADLKSWWKK